MNRDPDIHALPGEYPRHAEHRRRCRASDTDHAQLPSRLQPLPSRRADERRKIIEAGSGLHID